MRQTASFRRQQPYIIQPDLHLARYRGSIFDLRVIYQKDRTGTWTTSKSFCRVAPEGSGVSNLSRGGAAVTTKTVLSQVFRHDKALINAKRQEMTKLCALTAQSLETHTGKIFGELGLDLGIDRKGDFWIIEVNSRPRKTTTTDFSAKIVRNTFLRPLEYASYLAEFP
jgi:glutathione synthase/RimK-type ligase-like ATP-grasp enzyme